jgi:hypothetical protein
VVSAVVREQVSPTRRVLRVLGTFGVGVVAGLGWGVTARVFMRLISTAPEFSWAGTLTIIGMSGVIGGLVALVRLARRSGRSRWWRLLGLPYLLLFAGPGMLLLPGVVGVVMLLDRRRWLALPGAGLVVVTWWAAHDELGETVSVRQWTGLLVMLACVAVLGWAARELVRRWRPRAATADVPGVPPTVPSRPSAALVVSRDGEAGHAGWTAP